MMPPARIGLTVALCLLHPMMAQAAAWTQEAGKGQLIVNAAYYSASHFFTQAGQRVSQRNYSRYEVSPYFEYGLADGWTLGGKTFLQQAQQDVRGGTQHNAGLGESELFLRRRLVQSGDFVLSAEPMVKLPSPDGRDDTPLLGGPRPDVGMGLSGGYSFLLLERWHFANLDAQYRHRLGPQEDQVRLAATLGVHMGGKWRLLPQAFATLRTRKGRATGFTASNADDYDQLRLQFSTVYRYRDDLSFQLGVFGDVAGANTTAGRGILVSVWKNF